MADLDVYFMHDQPHECPKCGKRTTITMEDDDGKWQEHYCTPCQYRFRVEEEQFDLTDAQRGRVLDRLIEDFIDSVVASKTYVYDIAKTGFKGYWNYTDTELVREYRDTFDDDDYLEDEADG